MREHHVVEWWEVSASNGDKSPSCLADLCGRERSKRGCDFGSRDACVIFDDTVLVNDLRKPLAGRHCILKSADNLGVSGRSRGVDDASYEAHLNGDVCRWEVCSIDSQLSAGQGVSSDYGISHGVLVITVATSA